MIWRCLLPDMTKEEVDRIHRLLHEWSVGPDRQFSGATVIADQGAMAHRRPICRAIDE